MISASRVLLNCGESSTAVPCSAACPVMHGLAKMEHLRYAHVHNEMLTGLVIC